MRTVQKFEMGDPEAVVPRSNLMRGRRDEKHGGRVVAGVPWLLERLPPHRLIRVPRARGLALRRTVCERRLVGALHSVAYSVAGTSAMARDRATFIALVGQAGVGKTFLAAWLARDVRAQALARDGVIWIHCGRAARADDITGQLVHDLQALALGVGAGSGAIDDKSAAVRSAGTLGVLPDALRSRRCLIVLDDVWSAAALQPLLSTAASSLIVVFTTRNSVLARACAGGEHDSVVHVPKLDEPSAAELLCSSAFPAQDAFTSNLRDAVALLPSTTALLELCCGLPLVIVAAGQLVADCLPAPPALVTGTDTAGASAADAAERAAAHALATALDALRAEGLLGLPALSDPSYPFPTIAASMEATLNELSSDARQRCEQLAVADGGLVRIKVLREWWNVPCLLMAAGTSELRAWGLMVLVATPGASAATAAIQLSPVLRGLLLARMADDDVARLRAQLAAAEKLSATAAEKLSSIDSGGIGLGDEIVCDDDTTSLVHGCVRLHPVTSLCVRRPAVRPPWTVASILFTLSFSLLFVVSYCPAPDLFVRVVRVSYTDLSEPGSGGEAELVGGAMGGPAPAGSSDAPDLSEPVGDQMAKDPTASGGAAPESSAVSASEMGRSDVQRWPSVLPTLDAGERYPDLSNLPNGTTPWPQGVVGVALRQRRRLSAAPGSFQAAAPPRFQLEWMPVWQMLATRDALAQAMAARLATLDELGVHEHFQVALSAQWGVYLPVHAEGRSVAKFYAQWRPGGLVLFALGVSALALVADLCARFSVHSRLRGWRRWAALGSLVTLVIVATPIPATSTWSKWLIGSDAWRASERVAVYDRDGQQGTVGMYFVADYVGCAAPPFLGCGLWGAGEVGAFTLASVIWIFALAPAVNLALALGARVYKRYRPAFGRSSPTPHAV